MKNTLRTTGANSNISNILMVAAIVAAGIAGYMILTSNQTDKSNGSNTVNENNPSGNENNPSGNGSNSAHGNNANGNTQLPVCSAGANEFPLKMGMGSYSTNNNGYCEGIYVKNVQIVLNKLLKNKGKQTITVDGKFGKNTENAVIAMYGPPGTITKQLYDSMMKYF